MSRNAEQQDAGNKAMPNARSKMTLILLLAASVSAALPASVMAQQAPLPAAEQPLKPEKNPPGDIPDNQVFIDYSSPLGFALKVPEGWARQDLADGDPAVSRGRPSVACRRQGQRGLPVD